MKEVTLESLENELTTIGTNCLGLVILWSIHCPICKSFLEVLKNIELKHSKFKFFTVEADDVPLFAPPMIPSVSVFYNRCRYFEAVGFADEETLGEALNGWESEWENNIKKGR